MPESQLESRIGSESEGRRLPKLPAPRRPLRFTPEFEAVLRQLYIRLMVEQVPARLLAVLHPPGEGKT